jgi:hypothetical protein
LGGHGRRALISPSANQIIERGRVRKGEDAILFGTCFGFGICQFRSC